MNIVYTSKDFNQIYDTHSPGASAGALHFFHEFMRFCFALFVEVNTRHQAAECPAQQQSRGAEKCVDKKLINVDIVQDAG